MKELTIKNNYLSTPSKGRGPIMLRTGPQQSSGCRDDLPLAEGQRIARIDAFLETTTFTIPARARAVSSTFCAERDTFGMRISSPALKWTPGFSCLSRAGAEWNFSLIASNRDV